MSIESVVLAGGQSRRGGVGEGLGIKGLVLAKRIAIGLAPVSARVTILGDTPIPPFEFVPDRESGRGPMDALSGFLPTEEFVFVASSNLVAFRSDIVTDLRNRIGNRSAILPTVGGVRQPLCALYRSECFELLKALTRQGERRLDVWLKRLEIMEVAASSLSTPAACFNVKVPATQTKAAVNAVLRDQRQLPEPTSQKRNELPKIGRIKEIYL
jgi:molybdopterin-guanine dinucleotide biosynthesis protein A